MTDPGRGPATAALDAPPRWLERDEQVAWRGLVELTVKLPALLDAKLQREAALSGFEYGVLSRLSEEAGGTLRMSALAADCSGSLSRLSHAAKRLERLGLLERHPDSADGRYTIAALTEAGRVKVVEAAPGHVTTVLTHVIDALTHEQLTQLTDICRAVLGRIDPASPFVRGAVTGRGPTSGPETRGPEAQLSEAQLSEAQLSEAQLSEAQLSEAQLSEAQLSEAQLSEAQLSEAQLSEAQLSEAQLSEAQLSEAQLSEAQLSEDAGPPVTPAVPSSAA